MAMFLGGLFGEYFRACFRSGTGTGNAPTVRHDGILKQQIARKSVLRIRIRDELPESYFRDLRNNFVG